MRARRWSREDAEKGLTLIRARHRSEQETPIRTRNRPGQDADQGLSSRPLDSRLLLTRVCDGGAGVGRGDPFFCSTLHGYPLFCCRQKHVTGQSPQCQLFNVCLIKEWILGKSVFCKTFFENLDKCHVSVYSQTPFSLIIRFVFASTYSHIRIQIFYLMQKKLHVAANIR
jgi:hypothetical protein